MKGCIGCEREVCNFNVLNDCLNFRPTLTELFYADNLQFLYAQIGLIKSELETFGEIYLQNIKKKNAIFDLANTTIVVLLRQKEKVEDDIKRISTRHQTVAGIIRWHKN